MPTLAQIVRQKHPGAYDDLSDTQLEAMVDKKFPGAYSDVPRTEKPYDPAEGMNWGQAALTAMGKGFVDVGRGVKQRLVEDKLQTPFWPVNLANRGATALARTMLGSPEEVQADITESKRLDAPLMEKPGSGWGYVGGVAAPFALTALVPGAGTAVGSTALGALQGALMPTTEGESPTMNAAAGGAGGLVGWGAGQVLGRVVSPVRAQISKQTGKLIERADDFGIPLSLGAKTQSKPIQTMESALEYIPFTAGKAQRQVQATATGFNRAVAKTIGENADEIGPEVLNAATKRIGGEFERLAQNNVVNLGDDFINALAKVESAQTEFSSPAIKDAVEKGLNLASKGQISGKEYQLIRSTLGKAAKDAAASGNSELGGALNTIKGALDDAATASIRPDDAAAWQLAREQWANLKAVSKAAMPTSAGTVAGNVSPAGLSSALKSQNPQSLVLNQRGDLGELSRIGQAFVRPQIPNSGTAQRMLAQQLLTGGTLGGGTYLATGDPETALKATGLGIVAPIALQGVMSSPAVQSYVTKGAVEGGKRLAAAKLMEALMGPVGASTLLGMSR